MQVPDSPAAPTGGGGPGGGAGGASGSGATKSPDRSTMDARSMVSTADAKSAACQHCAQGLDGPRTPPEALQGAADQRNAPSTDDSKSQS